MGWGFHSGFFVGVLGWVLCVGVYVQALVASNMSRPILWRGQPHNTCIWKRDAHILLLKLRFILRAVYFHGHIHIQRLRVTSMQSYNTKPNACVNCVAPMYHLYKRMKCLHRTPPKYHYNLQKIVFCEIYFRCTSHDSLPGLLC